ncbi:MAG: EthD family reductase [Proteobacteria bacterium]|nr:MAG: EthD family reductase [Pseudomonadota bacterium]
MIKGFAFISKKPDISIEQFQRHWKEVHAPLALQITALRRYVQSHRSAFVIPGFEHVPFDGGAEIWFDDIDTMQGFGDNPEYVNGAFADEPNFISADGPTFLATSEHVIIPGREIKRDDELTKALFLIRRKAGMSVADFQAYWRNEHAPQIPRDAGVVRYVQCHTVPETYAGGTPAYDGVAELWWEDHESFRSYWDSERIQAIFAADAPRFMDLAGCTAFLVNENRVLWP